MQTSFYTYFHTRNDTGAVFYVGKGRGSRAHKQGRNPHWNNIAAKCGHTVHIAMNNLSEEEAFEHEKFLILCFKDMCIPLTNMTDGGDGTSGWVPSLETRSKLSAATKGVPRGPLSDVHKAKMSAAAKCVPRGPLPDATKAKISSSRKGVLLSDATKAKMSTSRKGVPLSDTHKAAIKTALARRKLVTSIINLGVSK